MTLTPESAAELLGVLSASSDSLGLPSVRPDQIVKVVEIELRSKARYAEIYARVLWSPDDDEDVAEPASGDGVSVWMLEADAAGKWRLAGGSSVPVTSLDAHSVESAVAQLEEQQAWFRPKPVAPRARRAAKARPALSEVEGAGTLAGTPRVGKPPRATDADVDVAEHTLGTRFPAGYRTFVVTLGEGVYGGKLRVYSPARVTRDLASWRERIERYWFWGEEPMAQATALESICLADTIDGDEIVFHPSDPDQLYLLPRHVERARSLGRGLATAISKVVRAKSPIIEEMRAAKAERDDA